jgi:MFS family permease
VLVVLDFYSGLPFTVGMDVLFLIFRRMELIVDYTSFLQVVHFRSVRAAGYLLNTYSFGSCITGIVLGFIIRYTGRYKIWAVIGVPIYILGTGSPIPQYPI